MKKKKISMIAMLTAATMILEGPAGLAAGHVFAAEETTAEVASVAEEAAAEVASVAEEAAVEVASVAEETAAEAAAVAEEESPEEETLAPDEEYEDRFIDASHLIALSKHPRKPDSPDADHIFKRTPEDENNRIYLFVRKNKDDNIAKEFYFLGELTALDQPKVVKIKTSNDSPAFEIIYQLNQPVKSDLYDYITSV